MSRAPIAGRFSAVSLLALASVSCADSELGGAAGRGAAVDAAPVLSTDRAAMPPELRAAYVAAMRSEAEGLSLGASDLGAASSGPADSLIWQETSTLTASDVVVTDLFARAIALDGDTALVGAPGDDPGAILNQGSVYVFTRSGGMWMEAQKLTASDGAASDNFGESIALLGDTAFVGANFDDIGAAQKQGSVYVFTRSGGMWMEAQKLTASDGAAQDLFGTSVALLGDTALVGASHADNGGDFDDGSAYVFTKVGGTWMEQQKLTASDGATSDRFGYSVALQGPASALVGSPFNDVGGNSSQGAAYVFTLSGGVWSEAQKLTGSGGGEGDMFALTMALSGDTVLMGAYYADGGPSLGPGAAYVFRESGGVWAEEQKLSASDGAGNDLFGYSVALVGDTALVGALTDDVGASGDQGSAYVFMRSGGVWTEQQKLTVSGGMASNNAGWSAALSGDTALVGVYYDDVGGLTQGSVRVFVVRKTGGDGCAADAECVSELCVDGVCCDAACGGGDAFDCQACSVATGAVADGVCGPVVMGTECRASAGECDAAEVCDGTAVDCPADVSAPDGAMCAGGTCMGGICMGAGGSGGGGGMGGAGGMGGSGGMGGTGGMGGGSGGMGGAGGMGGGSGGMGGAGGMGGGSGGMGGAGGKGGGAGGVGGAGGMGGVSDGTGGSGGSPDRPIGDPSSCDCRAAGRTAGGITSHAGLSLLGLALLMTRRRRRHADLEH